MIGFLMRAAIVALGLWVASRLVPGVEIRSTEALLVGGAAAGARQRRHPADSGHPDAADHRSHARVIPAGHQRPDGRAGHVPAV